MRRALLALLFWPALASAKASVEVQYRMEEVFSTATRFVRVDRGCQITDKDPDVAFVMFECPLEDKKVSRGGLEMFATKKEGRDRVSIHLTLPDDSHGAELRWLELLERKLRDERGAPVPPPKPEPPPKPPDMMPPPPF